MSTPADETAQTISFVQYLLPGLESGNFTLTATQSVSVSGQGESLRATQEFFVKGLRYQLDDSGVDSVFPPPGSQGEFGNVLPHIVLTDPTLPWQRSPDAQSSQHLDGEARRAGAAASAPVPTWLALLLFDEEDPPPQPQYLTIAALSQETLGQETLANGDVIFFPPRLSEYGEQQADPVTVIDVPVGRYAQITPSLADLTWLAHTRRTQATAKATVGDTPPAAELAVVFGNRLPTAGRTSTAFLVSLEGFGPYLPGDDGAVPDAIGSQVTAVRLVVLRTWTFSAIQLRQSFQGIVAALDADPACLQLPATSAPADDAGTAVSQAFGMGYTAMDHGLRDGSSTVSWYRGPLLPLGVTVPPLTPSLAADQLLRYDPGTGMFDVSYAAAWELGRLLALHDRAYATALYRWKLTMTQQAATALEEEIVDQMLPPLRGDQPQEQASDQAGDDQLAELPPRHRRLARVIRDVVGPAASRLAGPGSL